MDDLGDLRDFTAEGAFQSGADAADESQGVDAVADDQLSGTKSLKVQTVHFVAR